MSTVLVNILRIVLVYLVISLIIEFYIDRNNGNVFSTRKAELLLFVNSISSFIVSFGSIAIILLGVFQVIKNIVWLFR